MTAESDTVPIRSGAAEIHRLAQIERGAELAAGVRVGPFCVVGADARLDDGVELISHVVVTGRTRVGAGTKIYPFASVGHPPQDLKYSGEPSTLEIGAHCTIREGVTINPGTRGGGMATVIGDRCTLMANAHVGHDCRLGSDIVLSNNVMLAGHVTIGDFATLGGGAGVHQFVRIGAHAFVGGLSGLEGDLVPYGLAFGNRAALAGLNLIGLRRRGISRESVAALSQAFERIFGGEGVMADRIAAVASEMPGDPGVALLVGFLRQAGDRPVCKPRNGILAGREP